MREDTLETKTCLSTNKSTFMEEVQKYPCLYDKFSTKFKDEFKKLNFLVGQIDRDLSGHMEIIVQ